MTIVVEPEHLAIVRSILQRNLPADAQVWVYGSRATGQRIWRGSDLDLLIRADKELAFSILSSMAHEFSESLLPYMVDVHDWHRTSSEFLKLIQPDMVALALVAEAASS